MPPIFLHMSLAKDMRLKLEQPLIDAERGAYYLGATTPDIRVLTRRDRGETHFFDLNNFEHQDSVAAFFETHRHLAAPEHLTEQTAAFVCGYVTHLVLDERYISEMYRPHFGQLSALGGDLDANLMDRLLQYELDRRRREHTADVAEIRDALTGCSLAVDVGFLDSETLRKWQQVAIDQTQHPPDWNRFRYQGGRHLGQRWIEEPDAYAEFLKTIPERLQRVIDHVSTAEVDAYVEQSKEQAMRVVERYLGCG